MPNKGRLFLIPNVIAEHTHDQVLTLQVKKILPGIRYFLAEDVRTARRYLSSLKIYESIEALQFSVLDKDTKEAEVAALFAPVFEGHDVGVISESGCPGVADPGALAVKFAHRHEVKVIPLVGPSSILLALMASGLNGQKFSFHGYLPIEGKEAIKNIRELEKESGAKNQTQIFIETPYRNNAILQNLVKNLSGDTDLCVALDLTGDAEFIATRKVKAWRAQTIELPKKPAVFLFLAQ
ncbi:SAM-dependent methyltransferase [Fulvivirgaceae bacterium PWU4]|uniref:SAM-dependent methyltransferase n=1 Tax=Chryseosolibacter histidini TaxID=2782349 RepID=A0AAP2DLP0_9BACT|nr:SAM-dependent methyltransferase [Chryseosolibacter histidini]MBT1698625.1 SAM-dependent methyltransferase [Chryseosolibacter histidini]